MRAISSITSISRVTSRKRGVGTRTSIVPCPARGSKPSRSRISTARASDTSSAVMCATRSMRTRNSARGGRSLQTSIGRGVMCAPQSSTSSRAAAREATGARCGSTPFSQRLEPSVRRPSVCDVRSIWLRVKLAASSTTVRRALADLGVGAAHDAADALRALGVGDHEHRGSSSRSCPSSVRSVSPARARRAVRRAPRDARVVVGVQRAAEVVHDVVRDVDDVRDRAHARGAAGAP